jgi:hypothetical protein
VAFGVRDADAARAGVAAAGIGVGQVLHWSRAMTEPDVAGEARFSFFVGDYGATDDSFLCWTQHRTPELLRSPRLMSHANGVRRLSGVLVATTGDGRALVERYRRCGGLPVEGAHAVRFGEGAVEVARRDELPAAMVDNAWPAPNWVAGAVLGADDTGEIAARARASGCLVASHAGRIYIDTRPQLGCWLVVERTA